MMWTSIESPMVEATVFGGNDPVILSPGSPYIHSLNIKRFLKNPQCEKIRPGTYLRAYILSPILIRMSEGSNRRLDIGGFDGILSQLISNYTNSSLFLVDIDVEGLKRARSYGVVAIQASALTLPFPNESFDLVWALDLLEHLTDPAKALKEIYRVLKPGGKYLITTPIKGRNWGLQDREILELHKRWGHIYPGFSDIEITKLFLEARLSIEEVSGYFGEMIGKIYYYLYVSGGFPFEEASAHQIWRSAVDSIECALPEMPLEYIIVGSRPKEGQLRNTLPFQVPNRGFGSTLFQNDSVRRVVEDWIGGFSLEFFKRNRSLSKGASILIDAMRNKI